MKRSRITGAPGFLDLVDVICRGSTSEWQELYRRAQRSRALREELRQALELVEPELQSSRALWEHLLQRMEE